MGKFRSTTLSAKDGSGLGSYVQVYRRPGESVLADLNFFDGDRSIEELRELHQLLSRALAEADKLAKNP